MIWMTWQQHRSQALVGAIALALLSLFLLLTGMHIAADYQLVAPCLAPTMQASLKCSIILTTFQSNYQNMDNAMMLLLLFLPLMIGILVGAPLVAREVEQKTYLFAWTQGITRQQWMVVKLVLILLAGLLLEVAITGLWLWYHAPLETLYQSPLELLIFDTKGIVPSASVLLALSLAIAMGAITRRTVSGIALTILLYLAILLPVMYLRNNILPPTFVTWDGITQAEPTLPNDTKQMASGFMDRQMHVLSDTAMRGVCSNNQHFEQCLHDHHWLHYTAYLPASWFWPLQSIEALLFLFLAVILSAFTVWWTRYHIH